MKIAVDLSSLMWTCLLVGKDVEAKLVEFEGKEVSVNSAAYGYENAVNSLVAALREAEATPMDMIFVAEGMASKSMRLLIDRNYKAKRETRPPAAYLEFEGLKGMLMQTFGALGTLTLTQDLVEGDDTLAWLAKNSEEDLRIVTNDNDLSVLNGVNTYGANIEVRVNGVIGGNKYGNFPHSGITVYKALVGDSSDNIPGIKGFGPKAWEQFYSRFGAGGIIELARLAELGSLDELEAEAEQDPLVNRVFVGAEDFCRSYRLAKLYPEWVNTLKDPLKFTPGLIKGKVNDERLKQWSSQSRLVTAETWDQFRPWALRKIAERPWLALDIETSTPDESDDWLAAQDNEKGVDVIGSELTGMSLTFGSNMQYTVYIPVDHKDTANVKAELLRDFCKDVFASGVQPAIQNTSFEGTVLFHTWGKDWGGNGFNGFIPNWLDTKLEASYVDENDALNLKSLARKWFGYAQVDYTTTTTIEGVQYKMRELTAEHVFSYAADDTIVTASLHNFFKTFMQLEHTYKIYLDVEIAASYLHCQSFVHGADISIPKLKELEVIDDQIYDDAWRHLQTYLISKGWPGSLPPVIEPPLTAAGIKTAYEVVAGEPLKTMVRTPEKLIEMIRSDQPILAGLLETDIEAANSYVASQFDAAPEFNPGSPLQMKKLMYETMGLTQQVFNKPTETMLKAGRRQGDPKTDDLAIRYALIEASEELKPAIDAIRLMKMVQTRRGLYYKTYPYFVHWKTGKVHSSHNQCATNTRRASSSFPNMQQLAKHAKIEGQAAKFREVIIPHKKRAVIVSMDFSSQEILLMAEWSHDPELEAVILRGKDMHSMTAVGIYNNKEGAEWSYDEFKAVIDDQHHPLHKVCKKYRALAKTVNFSSQYRAAAKKMSAVLMVPEPDAQIMIDAKAAAFPVSEQWSLDEMDAVKHSGTVHTLMGAVRHLGPAVTSKDRVEAGKAERQALSYRIQGSAAEMTKKAEGRMWEEALEQRFDCKIIAPIHDEVVASVSLDDLVECCKVMHACMVGPYANMRLPITSSISFGPSFGQQIEIGLLPTEEAFTQGLKEYEELLCKQAQR